MAAVDIVPSVSGLRAVVVRPAIFATADRRPDYYFATAGAFHRGSRNARGCPWGAMMAYRDRVQDRVTSQVVLLYLRLAPKYRDCSEVWLGDQTWQIIKALLRGILAEIERKPEDACLDREAYLQLWDRWAERLRSGDAGSGPRDGFESVLDELFELKERLNK
jgi:hypothetical protein